MRNEYERKATQRAIRLASRRLEMTNAARARRRADILSGVTQTPVSAALIGAQALDECRAAAHQTGVTILLLPE